jgi:hypothetical protein
MGQAYSFNMVSTGNHEDFEKLAYNVSPEVTPLVSMIGKESVENDVFYWNEDSLQAPATTPIIEGASITATDVTAPTKHYNYCSQLERTFLISDKQQKIQQKQGGSFSAEKQLRNRTIEVRRDFEKCLSTNSTRVAGDSVTAMATAGLAYYINTTNFSTANVVGAASAQITEAMLLQAMQAQWDDHEPENMAVLMSSTNKMRVDAFSGGAVKNTNVGDKKLTNTVKIYESSFGTFKMIPSRYLTNTDVYVLDLNYIKSATLIPIEHKPLGLTKHAEEHMVQIVGGLKVCAIQAHARIQTLSAS